jgi:hypothetical protein
MYGHRPKDDRSLLNRPRKRVPHHQSENFPQIYFKTMARFPTTKSPCKSPQITINKPHCDHPKTTKNAQISQNPTQKPPQKIKSISHP